MRRHRCRNPYLFASSASPLALAQDPNPSSLRRRVFFFLFFFLLAAACKLLTYILPFFFCWVCKLEFVSEHVAFSSVSEGAAAAAHAPCVPPGRTYNCFQRVDRSSSFHRYKSEFLSVTDSAASADCLCDQSFEVGGKESEDLMTC
jgi:hypothetical protein